MRPPDRDPGGGGRQVWGLRRLQEAAEQVEFPEDSGEDEKQESF